jgi:hypothetical protein
MCEERHEIDRLKAEIERLRAVLNSDSANRYWEGRWRDEKAENERLRALLTAMDEQVAQ